MSCSSGAGVRDVDNAITVSTAPSELQRKASPPPHQVIVPATVHGKFLSMAGRHFPVQGVTYGPFRPGRDGDPFPPSDQVFADFAQMRDARINTIRTYYVPPPWFLEIADEEGMAVFIDIPWGKHLCFLDSRKAQNEAVTAVRSAAKAARRHPSVLAYSIGNEIPANIVRWHGAGRVERFLADVKDATKQVDPLRLVTYSNYPSTEYLNLSFLDFITFNVYLHDPEEFHKYLLRLQNLVGEKPLVLGELGMDSLRNGEEMQAEFLRSHLRKATMTGLAGTFVFSWTDDWFTGGHQIEEWRMGMTSVDRMPKPAYHALGDVYGKSPSSFLPEAPKVSVVVCSYNGGPTLDQCLRSLLDLDYPDYEVILVDDGSTDETKEIASRFPLVRVIHQANEGLSVARNVGLRAAAGSIIAYTDSDCFADPHWLSNLVYQLQHTGASAVGGPNLTPDDGWLPTCVSIAPGQPTHVLKSDQVAEHIPGCNMAFRREALEAINGFNSVYRKAGDDVDVCWRLQDAGMWITFSPGAIVWHHRRRDPQAYLRQQAGYGEAESLLWFDHPDRFNLLGQSKWDGAMYGVSLPALSIGKPAIYRGTFCTGHFQTVYRPGPAHWTSLPGTLEWHVVALVTVCMAVFWHGVLFITGGMLVVSLIVAALRSLQAAKPAAYRRIGFFLVLTYLSYLQPVIRSWWRYRTRFFPPAASTSVSTVQFKPEPLSRTGRLTIDFWDAEWRERTELIDRVLRFFAGHRWAIRTDAGWSEWDVQIHCHPWTTPEICSAQEDHGSGRRRIRVRFRLRPSEYSAAIGGLVAIVAALACRFGELPILAPAVVLLAGFIVIWARGLALSAQAAGIINGIAREMGLLRISDSPKERVLPTQEAQREVTASAIQPNYVSNGHTLNSSVETIDAPMKEETAGEQSIPA